MLIVTDDSEEVKKMAGQIAAAAKGHKVCLKTVAKFAGNDLLPAEVFFLGCEKPAPDSFAYLADLLKHINLAGRPCGVFSPGSKKAALYLAALVKDSEAALNPEPLLAGSAREVRTWVNRIFSNSRQPAGRTKGR